LSIYMNTKHVDLSAADRLVETVEDPIPRLNAEIARWIRDADLVVAGVDVTARTRALDRPVLSIYANRDGIVPPHAATAIAGVMRKDRVDLLSVGDEQLWYAHADLFIGRTSEERVFTPLAQWLRSKVA
jgi:pimeloyl-ACP methyl ester carboxylesterase